MRVLHVISTLDPRAGGPPAALVGLATAQRKVGLHASVLATFAAGCDQRLAEQLHEAGIPVRMVGPVRTPLGLHPAMNKAVNQAVAEADVVHIHALWEQIQHVAARTARRLGKPYIIRPCGMLDPWSLAQSRVRKRLYLALRLKRDLQQAAALHFTTERERDLTAQLKLSAAAIVEPNGLNLDEFDNLPAPGTFRNRYPQTIGRPLVLFLSRVHPKKGLDLLIPGFAQADIPDARLVIAGPGEQGYLKTLHQLIENHGLTNRVIFTGMLHGAERIAAFVDADLFALTSYQENFGNVVIESLASGTPVLISDQVNICDEVAKFEVGVVVPLDISQIGSMLHQWIIDARMLHDAGDRGANLARECYDWSRIAKRWMDHYTLLKP